MDKLVERSDQRVDVIGVYVIDLHVSAFGIAVFSEVTRQARRSLLIQQFFAVQGLIISKLAWAKDSHSEIQLGDVRNLLDTGYDAAYLRRWTRELRLDSLLEECLE